MDYSKQLENNEQRCRYGSVCRVQGTMPGGQPLEAGLHIFGVVPEGAVIESFRAIALGWDGDIVVSIGTVDDSTLFLDNVTLVDNISQGNPQDAPIELYTNVGVELVIEVTGTGVDGLVEFVIDYSELDTNKGAYTA